MKNWGRKNDITVDYNMLNQNLGFNAYMCKIIIYKYKCTVKKSLLNLDENQQIEISLFMSLV